MDKQELQILFEQRYKFIKIPKNKQSEIMNILLYCKEVRNTLYPMANSSVTQLQIVEFTARKLKGIYCVNGSLTLRDGSLEENRLFDAYIIESDESKKVRVYFDVERLCVKDEPKTIHTNAVIAVKDDNIISETIYTLSDTNEAMTYYDEFATNSNETLNEISYQLSSL